MLLPGKKLKSSQPWCFADAATSISSTNLSSWLLGIFINFILGYLAI